jgi:YegS/Rv2252/BmrU family lipid kinase
VLKGREDQETLPALGVIPLGSGNDFARTLQVTSDATALIKLIQSNSHKVSDVGRIQYHDKNGKQNFSYFINVADAGMGPEVVRTVAAKKWVFGSAFSYYVSILSTFFSYRPMQIHIKSDGWEWKGKLRTLAIGNAQYYGHGLCIAPDAKIDDGNFSSFLCADVSVLEFMRYSITLKNKKKINHTKVFYNTTQHMELTSETPCLIEADGEWFGYLPAVIDIISSRIKVICKN